MYELLFPSAWMLFLMYGINLLITALTLVCLWYIFVKMGEPGWKGLVPFYNIWIMVKRLKKPMRWFWIIIGSVLVLILALSVVSTLLMAALSLGVSPAGTVMTLSGILTGVSSIVMLVYSILLTHALSKSFGHGAGFTVGLLLLPVIFMPILAFGDSAFTEPEDPKPLPAPADEPEAVEATEESVDGLE